MALSPQAGQPNQPGRVHLARRWAPSAVPQENGRGGEIRTRDLYVPNVALYQAKLRPDLLRES